MAEIPELPPLYALEPGDIAIVAVPGWTDPEMVLFLDSLGLRPGVEVEVCEKHPFDGPLILRVDGRERTLGEKVAQQIFVRKVAPIEAPADPLMSSTNRREQST